MGDVNKPSRILQAVLETAAGLATAGVMEPATLREFERLCEVSGEESPPGREA
jgi:hypothetical protein